MKTDYLDVVQFHASPSRHSLQERGALDALLELKNAGKVRFIGMSGTLPHLIEQIAMGIFDVFQIPYSAVEREHEAAITAAARKAQASSFAPALQRGTNRSETGRLAVGALAPPVSMICSTA